MEAAKDLLNFCELSDVNHVLRSRQAVQRGPRWTKRRDAVTTKLNYKITTVQCLNVQRGSFTHYSPVVTPRTLPSVGRSTKWDTHHNSMFDRWLVLFYLVIRCLDLFEMVDFRD